MNGVEQVKGTARRSWIVYEALRLLSNALEAKGVNPRLESYKPGCTELQTEIELPEDDLTVPEFLERYLEPVIQAMADRMTEGTGSLLVFLQPARRLPKGSELAARTASDPDSGTALMVTWHDERHMSLSILWERA